jgi:hypothetical protein
MNLALSALIILLLLLPAFTFKMGTAIYAGWRRPAPSANSGLRHYLISRNVSKALSKLNFNDTIFFFSLVPLFLHLCAIGFITFKDQIRFDLLLNIFAGKDNVVAEAANNAFQIQLKSFLLYSLSQAFAGWLLGFVLSAIFMGSPLMLRALLSNNNWFRIFSGLTLAENDRARLHTVLVEALVLTKETTVIYSGMLQYYEVISDTDAIAYITLHSPSRRDLRAAQLTTKNLNATTESSTAYDNSYGPLINIPGNSITLQGKDILNVNVTYLELVPDTTSPVPGAKKLVQL